MNQGPPTSEQLERLHFMNMVLEQFWRYDIQDMLFYRMNPNNRIGFYVICNDVFHWASADLEEITEQNVEELRLAIAESLGHSGNASDGVILFCARMRKLRPQGAYYKHISSGVWPLLNEVGPERQINMANPKVQPRS